jgi:uncharacterized protein (TIGR02246 family)
MTDRQIATLERMAAAVNAGDAAGYAGVYAPDAVIHIPGGVSLQGRDAIERHEAELLEQFPEARLAFGSVWRNRDETSVHYAVTAPAGGGRSMGHEGLLFYRFDPDGLVLEERRYNDALTPMAQMGLLGEWTGRALPVLPTAMELHDARGNSEEEENVRVATLAVTAAAGGNPDALLACLSSDPVIDDLLLPELFRGREGAARYLEAWSEAFADARSLPVHGFPAGEFVLLEDVLSGTMNGRLGPLVASGVRFSVHRAQVIQFRGRKIVRLSFFMNGMELAGQLGALPASGRE